MRSPSAMRSRFAAICRGCSARRSALRPLAQATPEAPSRFKLVGVMAPRSSTAQAEVGQGLALIAVDGKPAKPYAVGARLDSDLVLQAVGLRTASIGPAQGARSVLLELPALPPPNSGVLPPPGGGSDRAAGAGRRSRRRRALRSEDRRECSRRSRPRRRRKPLRPHSRNGALPGQGGRRRTRARWRGATVGVPQAPIMQPAQVAPGPALAAAGAEPADAGRPAQPIATVLALRRERGDRPDWPFRRRRGRPGWRGSRGSEPRRRPAPACRPGCGRSRRPGCGSGTG